MEAKGKNIIHCCIERGIYDMLEQHCSKTGQAKTVAIKRAIERYCDKRGIPGKVIRPKKP